jgi:hypothetical protein
VKKTDEWIEADSGKRGCAVVSKQRIEKGKQAIERIAWWATAASVKWKLRAEWWSQVPGENIKMKRGGATLDAANNVAIIRRAFEFAQEVGEMIGHSAQSNGVFLNGGIASAAGKQPTSVVELACDKSASDGGGGGQCVGSSMLGAAEHDGATRHAFEASFEPAPVSEKTNSSTVLPAEAENGGREVDVCAEDEYGFEVVHRQRKLELALVLNAQRKAIAMHGESGREQVKRILERLGHGQAE